MMAAMSIYGKNLSKIFSGTDLPIPTKLGMNHMMTKVLQRVYKSCPYDDIDLF